MYTGKQQINQLANLGLLPSAFKRYLNLFTQEYRGDVTILPVPGLWEVTKTFSNLSKDEVTEFKLISARRTFPKINRIENILKIEQALENGYSNLKMKLLRKKFSSRKKFAIDEENYDFELGTRQLIDIYRKNNHLSLVRKEEEEFSVDEDENLDDISERHNSLLYYMIDHISNEQKGK